MRRGGGRESPIAFLFGTICPKVKALGPQTITSGPPPKPSVSGFGGERRRSRATEKSALAGCERCGACADEGLGRLPNKRFAAPRAAKIASVATLALLAVSVLPDSSYGFGGICPPFLR